MNCPLKHLHTIVPPEHRGYIEQHDWANKMLKTHYQVKCKGCNKYLIWVKRDKN